MTQILLSAPSTAAACEDGSRGCQAGMLGHNENERPAPQKSLQEQPCAESGFKRLQLESAHISSLETAVPHQRFFVTVTPEKVMVQLPSSHKAAALKPFGSGCC